MTRYELEFFSLRMNLISLRVCSNVCESILNLVYYLIKMFLLDFISVFDHHIAKIILQVLFCLLFKNQEVRLVKWGVIYKKNVL